MMFVCVICVPTCALPICLDCVNVRQDARLALRDALIEDGSVEASEKLDGLSHAPVDAFASVAELLQPGAERGELLVGVGVVALDHGQGGHGFAGQRVALALLPIAYLERKSVV